MNKKEKAEFDSLVINLCNRAKASFKSAGHDDAEDMAQDVALILSAARTSIPRGDFWKLKVEEEFSKAVDIVVKESKSRKRGLKLMDIESATTVPDVSTPYHFLIAGEIIDRAICNDLDSVMMGDTLEEEAEHYGVSRQRAHQITNEKRSYMTEYLQT